MKSRQKTDFEKSRFCVKIFSIELSNCLLDG